MKKILRAALGILIIIGGSGFGEDLAAFITLI